MTKDNPNRTTPEDLPFQIPEKGSDPDEPRLNLVEGAWQGVVVGQAESGDPIKAWEVVTEEGHLLRFLHHIHAVRERDKEPLSRLGGEDTGIVRRAGQTTGRFDRPLPKLPKKQ